MSFPAPARHAPLTQALESLARRQYFKLICGASFRDVEVVEQLVACYAAAGVDAIDIGPHPTLLPAVERGLQTLPDTQSQPLIMVSFDLDGDPHFRQVQVEEADCIVCSACIPVCPTDALFLGPSPITGTETLNVNDPRCYGCSRCVEVCPTDAFRWQAIEHLAQPLLDMLHHPLVQAVELHTHHLQCDDLNTFWQRCGDTLTGKLISLCFRPQAHEPAQVANYLETLSHLAQDTQISALMLQIDGQPMSGNDDPTASLPALQAARDFLTSPAVNWPVTISGGVNLATATLLHQPPFATIAGVGMGTVARQWVWPFRDQPNQAIEQAQRLVDAFRR